jgi:uncharacterized protein YifE (UPF0438 family)
LQDVRGIQLSNAMKNMDVGELRPRQANEDEDNQVHVLSNSNVQDDTNQVQVALMIMCKINKWCHTHF